VQFARQTTTNVRAHLVLMEEPVSTALADLNVHVREVTRVCNARLKLTNVILIHVNTVEHAMMLWTITPVSVFQDMQEWIVLTTSMTVYQTLVFTDLASTLSIAINVSVKLCILVPTVPFFLIRAHRIIARMGPSVFPTPPTPRSYVDVPPDIAVHFAHKTLMSALRGQIHARMVRHVAIQTAPSTVSVLLDMRVICAISIQMTATSTRVRTVLRVSTCSVAISVTVRLDSPESIVSPTLTSVSRHRARMELRVMTTSTRSLVDVHSVSAEYIVTPMTTIVRGVHV